MVLYCSKMEIIVDTHLTTTCVVDVKVVLLHIKGKPVSIDADKHQHSVVAVMVWSLYQVVTIH